MDVLPLWSHFFFIFRGYQVIIEPIFLDLHFCCEKEVGWKPQFSWITLRLSTVITRIIIYLGFWIAIWSFNFPGFLGRGITQGLTSLNMILKSMRIFAKWICKVILGATRGYSRAKETNSLPQPWFETLNFYNNPWHRFVLPGVVFVLSTYGNSSIPLGCGIFTEWFQHGWARNN